MENNVFLTAKEIANILKISKALAYRLVSEGQIPSVRFGKTVRVPKLAFDAFVQEKTVGQEFQDLSKVPDGNS